MAGQGEALQVVQEVHLDPPMQAMLVALQALVRIVWVLAVDHLQETTGRHPLEQRAIALVAQEVVLEEAELPALVMEAAGLEEWVHLQQTQGHLPLDRGTLQEKATWDQKAVVRMRSLVPIKAIRWALRKTETWEAGIWPVLWWQEYLQLVCRQLSFQLPALVWM